MVFCEEIAGYFTNMQEKTPIDVLAKDLIIQKNLLVIEMFLIRS